MLVTIILDTSVVRNGYDHISMIILQSLFWEEVVRIPGALKTTTGPFLMAIKTASFLRMHVAVKHIRLSFIVMSLMGSWSRDLLLSSGEVAKKKT